ncbi:PREDICTED: hexokinase-2-like [Papilio xuthus]|uniref:Phosphotransferase n=1 Tax=Papilio xuthus TaxID=66420 RepID=A0AAJ7E9V7_PAPXU|nr:PREDICTED: hexokinase-2-like [Papilio xuthus]
MSTAVENFAVGGEARVNGSQHNGSTQLNGSARPNGSAQHNGLAQLNGTAQFNGSGQLNGSAQHNGTARRSLWDAQFLPPPLVLEDRARALKIQTRLAGLVLCGQALVRVGETFARELERGLCDLPSSLQMENTYVPELPDGTEEGVFLALDLGGTNFRVLLLQLAAGQLVRERVRQYHISDALRSGPGEDLFGFLADCVQDFLRGEGMEEQELSLGFTFSFPMRQHSISSGELLTWTKSFCCGGMAGRDVAAMLQHCLHERGLRVRVQVLLNDTTGTLVAGAHRDPDVGIGVIMGTGSNGCYVERAERVQHWEAGRRRARDVVVDVEWGAFGDNGCLDFLRTDYDAEVDERSLLTASFTFEKYIGGKYLGELLGVVLGALARDGLFPAAPAPAALTTAHLSVFEEENCAGAWRETADTLEAACGAHVTRADALVAQHVARVISNRAAQLVSVCVAWLLRRMARERVAVAVDGSVYKRHPRIQHLMNKYVALLAPEHPFTLLGAEDGSGKGSALTAAIAARVAARHLP